jgi:uncharacterized membrane protein YebE (DUF533 family)
MSKNTMIYGLLIAGGLLAYYAWKKNSTTSNSTANSGLNSSNSGTFVDDVPVLGSTGTVEEVKSTLSKIVEPLIGTKAQTETNDVRPLEVIQETTYDS